MHTNIVAAEAPFRLLGHLDLSDQAAGGRVPAGELDTGCFTDQTASAVAPDEILGPQRKAGGHRDVDARDVLLEPGHLASAVDRHTELADPLCHDALDGGL